MIAFTVSYTLKEYLSFVQAHAAKEAAQARLAWPVRLLIGIVGTVMFAIKKHRMPVCHFAIDEEGIVRSLTPQQAALLDNLVRRRENELAATA